MKNKKAAAYYIPAVTENDAYGRPTQNVITWGIACESDQTALDVAESMVAKMKRSVPEWNGRGYDYDTGFSPFVMKVVLPSK